MKCFLGFPLALALLGCPNTAGLERQLATLEEELAAQRKEAATDRTQAHELLQQLLGLLHDHEDPVAPPEDPPADDPPADDPPADDPPMDDPPMDDPPADDPPMDDPPMDSPITAITLAPGESRTFDTPSPCCGQTSWSGMLDAVREGPGPNQFTATAAADAVPGVYPEYLTVTALHCEGPGAACWWRIDLTITEAP